MIKPADRKATQEAAEARKQAEEQLSRAQASRPEVRWIVGSFQQMLEEDHFSTRLAHAMGLDDDRR